MEEQNKIEKNPHFYKTEFNEKEALEVISWFEARMDKLPQTLKINEAISTENLPKTVKALITVVKFREKGLDVTFSCYLAHLLMIRLRLTEQGME